MKTTALVVLAVALTGCATLEPWTEADKALVAKRCGRPLNPITGVCDGMRGAWVYTVKRDDSAATSVQPLFGKE